MQLWNYIKSRYSNNDCFYEGCNKLTCRKIIQYTTSIDVIYVENLNNIYPKKENRNSFFFTENSILKFQIDFFLFFEFL